MKRDSFIFYRSFYEAIENLPEQNQLLIYKAIVEFSLNFKNPNLKGIENSIFILIKPQLEANQKRYINGTKPKDYTNKQNRSKTEAKPKQKTSKSEANVNENENVNVNENGNVNGAALFPPPPSLQEFISFAILNKPNIDTGINSKLVNRYQTYQASNWIDKDGNSIAEYWKAKVMAFLPHIDNQSEGSNGYKRRTNLAKYLKQKNDGTE